VLIGAPGSSDARRERRGSVRPPAEGAAAPAPSPDPPPPAPEVEPPPAPLDEGAVFKAHYARGVEHYAAQRYKEAITEFEAALAYKGEPRLLFNIAQCYRKQELFTEAIEYFDKYLQADPDVAPAVRAEVGAYQAELHAKKEARLAAAAKPKVIMVNTEKPPPRFYLPLGATGVAVGLAAVAVGGAFLGIHGTCADTPEPSALECDRMYSSLTPGVALTAVGGSMAVLGTVLLGLSLRRPRAAQPPPLSAMHSSFVSALPLIPIPSK
jgi:hypothetical protein